MDEGYDAINMRPGPGTGGGQVVGAAAGRGIPVARQRQGADGPGVTAAPVVAGRSLAARAGRFVLPGLLALAAVMRLPNLVTRGTWEADQGHDMLTLRLLVQDGIVPLLGPPTSIGDVHHGAWYYYLLSPAAALTAGDSPLAVVALIALAGIAAVGVVWWLARAIGGPVAGAVAGLAMALSAAAIDESTFIWNPNLIALSSAAGPGRHLAGLDRRRSPLVAPGRIRDGRRRCSATCSASRSCRSSRCRSWPMRGGVRSGG